MDSIENKSAKIIKTIHLIRHGQTDFNLFNIIQGSGIDSNLNATGIAQARLFYNAYKHIAFDHVYTSELKRTFQSVEMFIKTGIPHTKLKGLNEINWGIMEGQKGTIDRDQIYQGIIEKWKNGILDISVEGGETPIEMLKRQEESLSYIMNKKNEKSILICMHGRAIRSFLCLLTDIPLKDMEKWEHSNLCLYELSYNGSCFDIIRINDITHL